MGLLPSWSATDALALQRLMGHHVSDSSLSLTLPTGHRHWGHWCKRTYIVVTRLDYCKAILAGTADTVIKRLQSVQKTSVLYRPPLGGCRPPWLQITPPSPDPKPDPSNMVIVSKSTILSLVSTYMNSAYDRLKIFEVVLGCRHRLDNQCQKYRH